MIICTSLLKQDAFHAVYAGLHFDLGVVISRLSAKGKIIACLSVVQYLTELNGL